MFRPIITFLLLVVAIFVCNASDHISAENLLGQKHPSELVFDATLLINGPVRTGTAFCVSCDSSKSSYLITARHVLDSIPGDTAYAMLRFRSAGKSVSVKRLGLLIRDHGRNLYQTLGDPSIDVAAVRLVFSRQEVGTLFSDIESQIVGLPRQLLATSEDIKKFWVHPGDQVFFLGYPLGRMSPSGFYPILRSGFVGSYPILPLEENPFILLDATVFEGNSGGPVYFEYMASGWNGRSINQDIKIIGLVSFAQIPDVKRVFEQKKRREDLFVAGILNSAYISKLLDSIGCK